MGSEFSSIICLLQNEQLFIVSEINFLINLFKLFPLMSTIYNLDKSSEKTLFLKYFIYIYIYIFKLTYDE